ncbi:MAG: glycosyltransferase family 39 protein [bacterium]|nr:glycosyltransferase family 39 protein [bacterium]
MTETSDQIKENTPSSRTAIIILTEILICMLMLHVYWVLLNNAPPVEDDNMQLFKSLEYHYESGMSFKQFFIVTAIGRGGAFYPHFVYLVTSIFYNLLGVTEYAARISMLPFLVLMTYSTYGLGKRLWGVWAGFTAALAALTASSIQHYSHSYFLDIPLTAAVIFHLYAIHASAKLTDKKGCLLWGFSLALGFMIKWTFLLWVLVPEIFLLGAWLFSDKKTVLGKITMLTALAAMAAIPAVKRTNFGMTTTSIPEDRLVSFFIFLAIVLVIGSILLLVFTRKKPELFHAAWGFIIAAMFTVPWYAENTPSILEGLTMAQGLAVAHDINQATVNNWMSMTRAIYGLNILLPIAVLAGLRKGCRKNLFYNIICAFTGLALMTMSFVHAERYALPAIPPLCILTFSWISLIKKYSWIATVLFAPVFLWQASAWTPAVEPYLPLPSNDRLIFFDPIPRTAIAPDPKDYGVKQVLADLLASGLRQASLSDPYLVWLMCGDDNNFVQGRTINYYMLLYRLPMEAFQIEPKDFANGPEMLNRITRDGDFFLAIWKDKSELQYWIDTIKSRGWKLQHINDYPITETSTISTFRRTHYTHYLKRT